MKGEEEEEEGENETKREGQEQERTERGEEREGLFPEENTAVCSGVTLASLLHRLTATMVAPLRGEGH